MQVPRLSRTRSQVPYEYTVMEQVQRTRTENYTEMVATTVPEQQSYVVCVPVQKSRVENYTEMVPTTTPQQRTVTTMTQRVESRPRAVHGQRSGHRKRHAELQRLRSGSGTTPRRSHRRCRRQPRLRRLRGCGGCGDMVGCGPQLVSVPYEYTCISYRREVQLRVVPVTRYTQKVETRNVNVTVCVPETKQITVNVTTMQPVQKQRTVNYTEMQQQTQQAHGQRCSLQPGPRTRQVNYVECVPTKKQGQQTVTEYSTVMENKTETYTEMTAREVEREVPTQVCHTVARKIQVPVAPVTIGYGCGYGYNDSGYGGGHCGSCGQDHGCGGDCDSGCGGKHRGGKGCKGGKRGCR